MGRILDFNSVEIKTLDIILRDDDRTEVHLKFPTEGLVQELVSISPELHKAFEEGDTESLTRTYDLVAKLINCNRDGIKVTGEELRKKYRMDFELIILFCANYLDFIQSVSESKN